MPTELTGPPAPAAAPSTTPAGAPARLVFGPFLLDGPGGRLLRDGREVDLAPRPFAVLCWLAARPGVLVSKDELLDGVWGHRHVSDSVLKVAMNALRGALGEDAKAPRWIETVPRRGYRFADDVRRWDGAAPATTAGAPPHAAAVPAGPPAGAAAAATSAATGAAPGNLPAETLPLVGRDDDLDRLRRALATQRLVTLTGPGGVGKTRLALAAVAFEAPADGVWLLRLEALAAADEVAPALARTLGLAADAGHGADALARALAPLAARIVLDNAEHLSEGLAPLLAAWRDAAPQVGWLLTSQRPLRLAGEQVLPLAPLALPGPGADDAALRASPAVALFVQRVQALRPDWTPDAAALRDAAAIAQALDGLPLALELAAARVPLLGTAGVRERLSERLQLLTRGSADAPDRHRTLRAALAWSVGLLPPRAASLLARLAVMPGSFTLAAAQAVGGTDPWAVLDDLELLRELSLLMPAEPGRAAPNNDDDGDAAAPAQRLRLFDSVRALAAERLAAAGDADATQDAHLAWTLATFTAAETRLLACAEADWLAPLEPEAAHLVAAMTLALRRAEAAAAAAAAGAAGAAGAGDAGPAAAPAAPAVTAAVQLLAASAAFCVRAGLKPEARGWLARLQVLLPPPGAALDERPGAAWPPALQAHWQQALAVLGALGQLLPPQQALAACEVALPVLRAQGRQGAALYLAYHRAMLLARVQRGAELPAAVQDLRALLGPDSTLYERRLLAWVQAMIARDRGDVAAYGAFWADMLAQSRALDDAIEGWRAAWGLGQALYLQGALDDARTVLDRAVDELRAAGRLRAFSAVAAQAAVLRVLRDAAADTLARLREALRLLQGEGQVWWLADALAWVPLHQGRLDDARRLQAWADGLVAQRGEARGPVFAKLRAAFDARLAAAPPPDATRAPSAPPADEAAALALVFAAAAD
ncbi:MAG: helix-turn-helix transcriptional regulator [Rubrivivax sp.]|nr:helix-turn-helix transcriptional regulator [Rubrivivax sp.]